ncbi:MAG: hypothetical protein ACRYGP_16890 [Janthinobacterium lividum]
MLDLAKAAGLSVMTVKRMEMSDDQAISDHAFGTVQAAFEEAGVRFSFDVVEGLGIRLQLGANKAERPGHDGRQSAPAQVEGAMLTRATLA